MPQHETRAHAMLSASGSKRWLACTPSALLERQFPDEQTVFSQEGTWAHELSELLIRTQTGLLLGSQSNVIQTPKDSEWATESNIEAINMYVTFVIEQLNTARAETTDAVMLLEQRLDFSQWVPNGFGTGDVVIIADGTMQIIDLKFGKGVQVDAEDNSQMMLYAIGALNVFDMLYDIKRIKMTIVQPRIGHLSSWEIDVDSLLKWASETVKVRAEMAAKGEGEFVAGEHCRFCKARFTCKARADHNLKLAKADFNDPALLTNDEIAEILGKLDDLEKWAADIKSHALKCAERGEKFNGWKLVEGRSIRKYTSDTDVADTLIKNGFNEESIFKRELLGLTDMEKLLGKKKFSELLDAFIVKPQGKPTLVPVSDKRTELRSNQHAREEFSS